MIIGVISDTHISSPVDMLPAEILRRFRKENVGLILHAGDLVHLSVLDALGEIAEVRAVAGNMDPTDVRQRLPVKRVEEVEGVRIGMIHGSGPGTRLGERLLPVFEGDRLHVLVHGHAHEPRNTDYQGVLLFNPGCTSGSRSGGRGTFGLLHLENGQVCGEIIEVI